MKKVTHHKINLSSWINSRVEWTSLNGEFPSSMIKGEGHEFSFMMANHEDPELIKEALLEIVQDLQDSIPGFAETIAKENKLSNFLQNGNYRTDEVVCLLQGLPNQVFEIELKEKL